MNHTPVMDANIVSLNNASATANYNTTTNTNYSQSSCPNPSVDPSYEIAVSVIGLGTISIIAIAGNTLTFVVLNVDRISARSRSSVHLLLLCLAVLDILFALDSVFVQLMPALFRNYSLSWPRILTLLHPYFIYFGSAVRMMRNWTIVLVSIERWVVTCRPLHARTLCTTTKVKWAFCLVLISACYNIPRYFEVTPVEKDCGGYRILVYTYSLLRTSEVYRYVYLVGLYVVLVSGGPMIILTVLNMVIVREIRRLTDERGCLHLVDTSRMYVVVICDHSQ